MGWQLRHNGLITCPFAWERKPVICWLRLYEDSADVPKWLVVVTEVPGNPGGSISNQYETVQSALADQFDVDLEAVVWFHAWPVGLFGGKSSWTKIDKDGFSHDGNVSRADVERLVGMKLTEIPDHEVLYRQVLERGGGVWDEVFLPIFDSLPVADLPFPHLPSRCEHYERFGAILEGVPESEEGGARDLEAGRRFLESLTPVDLAGCRYHKANWEAIADESVRVLNQVGDRANVDDYISSAQGSKLASREKGWLISLFDDPILVGGGSYTNGQHRGCALRFSGSERAAIHIDDESLGEMCADWTYGGGG
jgi:hypothetical protein